MSIEQLKQAGLNEAQIARFQELPPVQKEAVGTRLLSGASFAEACREAGVRLLTLVKSDPRAEFKKGTGLFETSPTAPPTSHPSEALAAHFDDFFRAHDDSAIKAGSQNGWGQDRVELISFVEKEVLS